MANTALIILNIYYTRTVMNRQWKRYYLITGLIHRSGRAWRIMRKYYLFLHFDLKREEVIGQWRKINSIM
jgi:hypothetical protein